MSISINNNPAGSWNMLVSHFFLILTSATNIGCIRVNVKLSTFILVIFKFFVVGNCHGETNVSISNEDVSTPLPIDTIFKLPAPLPTWPTGGGFGTGEIDLGGLQIRQVSSFQKIWAANQGGPDNLGATFFEPSSIPYGFSMLGAYAQPNNRPLSSWVLVGKTNASDELGDILKRPIDYTLHATITTPNASCYVWLPNPPDGYKPVGLVVATSPDKPSLDKIRCVRSDFTDEPEADTLIWADSKNGLKVSGLSPKIRGTNATALSVGAFIVQNETNDQNQTLFLSCLKNKNSTFSSMPNLNQTEALFETYSPYIYFHPKEKYLPSSVNWFFSNGALLYKKGNESNPVPVEPDGSNLPQGGSNDGSYWLDLPVDKQAKKRVQQGDLESAEVYLHVRAVLGGAFTDIQVWVFYPFNGPAKAKVSVMKRFSLGKIGEHVGDWEHVTLRISNFHGVLHKVYFAQHNGGEWVDSCLLEFENGSNKFVGYSSLNGHASYHKAGLVLLGDDVGVGIRDDTSRSDVVMDTGRMGGFTVVAADGLSAGEARVPPPPWLLYARKWGPHIDHIPLTGELKELFEKSSIKEVLYEDGPTGPKVKNQWDGDEI